jgi:hypothetical protein
MLKPRKKAFGAGPIKIVRGKRFRHDAGGFCDGFSMGSLRPWFLGRSVNVTDVTAMPLQEVIPGFARLMRSADVHS